MRSVFLQSTVKMTGKKKIQRKIKELVVILPRKLKKLTKHSRIRLETQSGLVLGLQVPIRVVQKFLRPY